MPMPLPAVSRKRRKSGKKRMTVRRKSRKKGG